MIPDAGNLLPRGRRLRLASGLVGLLAFAAGTWALVAFGAPRWTRIALFVPAWVGLLGILQASART